MIPFLRKKTDNKPYQGRNFFDSKTNLWLVENFPSAKKFSTVRLETGEKLRKMSKGAFSLVKFNELRTIARDSIGVSFEETEIIIVQLVKELRGLIERDDELDQQLKQLIDDTVPNLLTVPGIGYRLAGILVGEIGDASQFPTPDKLVKYAGLDVRIYQSGTIEIHGKLRKRPPLYLDTPYFKLLKKREFIAHCWLNFMQKRSKKVSTLFVR